MLVVLGLLCSLYLQASSTYDFKVDGIYYNILSSTDFTCSVTYGSSDYNSYSGDIVIPEQVTYKNQTYTVTTINGLAFWKCAQLTSVNLPNRITTIASNAFIGCKSLKSIVIPPLVTKIPSNCFEDCEDLSSIDLANVTTIEGSAFSDCSSLESLFIPKSVTKVSSAFYGCKSLQTVIFENGTEELELYTRMFSDCLLDSVYLGRNISDGRPFEYNKSLRSIYISDAVTSLPAQPFYNCTNLQYV